MHSYHRSITRCTRTHGPRRTLSGTRVRQRRRNGSLSLSLCCLAPFQNRSSSLPPKQTKALQSAACNARHGWPGGRTVVASLTSRVRGAPQSRTTRNPPPPGPVHFRARCAHAHAHASAATRTARWCKAANNKTLPRHLPPLHERKRAGDHRRCGGPPRGKLRRAPAAPPVGLHAGLRREEKAQRKPPPRPGAARAARGPFRPTRSIDRSTGHGRPSARSISIHHTRMSRHAIPSRSPGPCSDAIICMNVRACSLSCGLVRARV